MSEARSEMLEMIAECGEYHVFPGFSKLILILLTLWNRFWRSDRMLTTLGNVWFLCAFLYILTMPLHWRLFTPRVLLSLSPMYMFIQSYYILRPGKGHGL